MSGSRRYFITIAAGTALLLTSTPQAQQGSSHIDALAIRAAVERALSAPVAGRQALQSPAQSGVRLLDLTVEPTSPTAERVTIDLSQRALTFDPSGDTETILDHILTSTAALTSRATRVEYRFLIDGLPLDQFLSRPPERPRTRRQLLQQRDRVVVSPGHGWYWNEDAASWLLQRDHYWGIVEDVVNWEIANYLQHELMALNLEVWPARHPDRFSVLRGESGYPEWQESAKYFIKGLGAPPIVWNVGINNYARDINSRPFFANWLDAAVMISIHNNGGGGTGTETWFDASNGQEQESERLASIVNSRIVAAVRARYDPNWPDRGLRSCNGCKGENRLTARPAIIVEAAFMDTRRPDNDALHDETFKRIVADAIRDGVLEWSRLGGEAFPLP